MQTDFSPIQLADPAMASSESVIRKCVHCGFCTATCPTYVLLGDELDSPRGRIYLMKEMLENERQPDAETVKHVDRCLSCLSCMTTCPSGVNYMHLADHARAYIEQHYRRPFWERWQRALVAFVLPHPGRFRAALQLARLTRPLAPLFARSRHLRPLAAMLSLAPDRLPPRAHAPVAKPGAKPVAKPGAKPVAKPGAKGRVVLLQGCAEPVLRPAIREATLRLLERCGYAVSFAPGEQCCGALVHHMGRDAAALAAARRNVDAWTAEDQRGPPAAIIVTTSGCGTHIKDYGFMLRNDPLYAERAAKVSALAKDISEFLEAAGLPEPLAGRALTVAYHSACSMQHGQKITVTPQKLLRQAGFTVRMPAESHLCCGSAGTYNIFQPEIAGQLGDRKAANLSRLGMDVIATGNIGCAVQIGQRTGGPVLHTVELLDWATGGPTPAGLAESEKLNHASVPILKSVGFQNHHTRAE